VTGLLGLVGAVCALTGAAAVAGFFGQLWWLFDLCSHFRVQYAVVLGLGLAIYLLARHRVGATLLLLVWLLNLAPMLPLWFGDDGEPESPSAGEVATLRVMTLNVFSPSDAHGEVIALVREEAPAVIAFQEITGTWERVLTEALAADYPYRLVRPRSDHFGMALFSRHPMVATVDFLGELQLPVIDARVTALGRTWRIVNAHPRAPSLNAESHRHRDEYIRQLAARVGDVCPSPPPDPGAGRDSTLTPPAAPDRSPGVCVVLGDFNASQWSAAMRDFRRGTDLRHSAVGHGLHLTWPTSAPLFSVPLDHILVSDQVWVVDSRVGPVVGSDHRPVLADLAPGEPTPPPPTGSSATREPLGWAAKSVGNVRFRHRP